MAHLYRNRVDPCRIHGSARSIGTVPALTRCIANVPNITQQIRTFMVATSLFDVEFIPLKATVTASIEGPLRRKASVLAHRVAVESTE